MKHRLKYLTLCTLSLMLSACGGGSGGGGNSNSVASNPADVKPQSNQYPEPLVDVVDQSILGFYDSDQNGTVRVIRNDLEGDFKAMVQFAQSHTVNPKNNENDRLPRLTSEKDALLLITPTLDMGNIQQLKAEIYDNNKLIRSIDLQDPSRLAASDQNTPDDRPQVNYSKKAWSAVLSWKEVKPGLSIRIIDPIQGKNGELRAQNIDFAMPAELVVQNIRLGLLTTPPNNPVKHYMLLEPEKAGTDYLQTIPAAHMIVSQYDDMKLDKVLVSNGTIYDSVSQTKGDVYNGDMREDVAKSTFSVGINLANWGATSSSMQSQSQPQLTQSVVVHHAQGNYSNGIQEHGLSGGNGMLTLFQSLDNEFSHEIGHHFELGHYPGSVGNNKFWAEHHANSGWGYIAYRNRMRGNLNWVQTDLSKLSEGVSSFKNLFAYGRDAMSDGEVTSSISKYTHYTGYSTQMKIQPALEKLVWAEDSATGYKKWNAEKRIMEEVQPKVPQSNMVWFNSISGNYLKPKSFNVPVFTILGGYDPDEQKGLIYPAARGNWGQVFDLPKANTLLADTSCWLDVQFANKNETIALAPQRMESQSINKFHVNLAQSDQPKRVDLYCKKQNQTAVKLSSINIPVYASPLKPYVAIGQKDGFNALKKIELPELEQELLANSGKPVVQLSANAQLLYASYQSNKSELSGNAQKQLDRYTDQQSAIARLNRWVNTYQTDLISKKPEAITALNQFLNVIHLQDENLTAQSQLIKNGTNCLKAERLSNGQFNTYVSAESGCKGDDSEQWIYDVEGKIHSKIALDQCLAPLSQGIGLTACNHISTNQIWTMNAQNKTIVQNNKCFDVAGGSWSGNKANLIQYACTGNSNQQWTMLQKNSSLILAHAQSKNIPLIFEAMQSAK